MSPTAVMPGDTIAGKYKVERLLAKGGMGQIVVAHHEGLGRQVAIKLMRADKVVTDGMKERFRREVQAMAHLGSQFVAEVYDVDETEDGMIYMVMELLDGRDLNEIVRDGALEIDDALRYVQQAAVGVAMAHGAGIIHRDLKPHNLFVAKNEEGEEQVKILDFGISKITEAAAISEEDAASLTSTQAVLGTPAYMSPEQIVSAKHVDGRSDVWSLGAILHELLTGKVLFDGESAGQILAKVLSTPIKPPSDQRPEVTKELDNVVMKCLNRDRELRYETVNAFVRELSLLSEGTAETLPAFDLPKPEGLAAPRAEQVTALTWGSRETEAAGSWRRGAIMGFGASAVVGVALFFALRPEPPPAVDSAPAAPVSIVSASASAPVPTPSAVPAAPSVAPSASAAASASAAPSASAAASTKLPPKPVGPALPWPRRTAVAAPPPPPPPPPPPGDDLRLDER